MTVGLIFLAALAAPPPTPTPAGGQAAGSPNVQVEVLEVPSMELRRGLPNLGRCVEVPKGVLRGPSWAASVAYPHVLAGAGTFVGVLEPPQGRTMRLRIFQDEKLTNELFLPLPAGQPLSLPAELFLEASAPVAAVRFREGTAVYAGATLTAFQATANMPTPNLVLTDGEAHWFPWPREAGLELKTAKELPALWVRTSLDDAEQEVLLRVEGKKVQGNYPFADEWVLSGALRRDGKLWLVGLQSGEAMVATTGGRVLRRQQIPYRFPTEHEAPDLVERARKQLLAEAQEDPLFADATRKPQKEVVVKLRGRTRIFWEAYARGNDLVLVTTSFTQPASALLWFSEELDHPPRCFWFHDIVPQELRIAVTEDALWLMEPLGFVAWEDLRHLWENTQKQEKKGSTPSRQ
ncbi:hypothetical protein HRbin09_00167 [bacterium HR09]|nr:hypothetical protein HRbin09_00167 [bacterium HR09]